MVGPNIVLIQSDRKKPDATLSTCMIASRPKVVRVPDAVGEKLAEQIDMVLNGSSGQGRSFLLRLFVGVDHGDHPHALKLFFLVGVDRDFQQVVHEVADVLNRDLVHGPVGEIALE